VKASTVKDGTVNFGTNSVNWQRQCTWLASNFRLGNESKRAMMEMVTEIVSGFGPEKLQSAKNFLDHIT